MIEWVKGCFFCICTILQERGGVRILLLLKYNTTRLGALLLKYNTTRLGFLMLKYYTTGFESS